MEDFLHREILAVNSGKKSGCNEHGVTDTENPVLDQPAVQHVHVRPVPEEVRQPNPTCPKKLALLEARGQMQSVRMESNMSSE